MSVSVFKSWRPFFSGLIVAALVANPSKAGDWRQFRGNQGNSVAASEVLPTELSGGTVAWKVDLPGRGLSGPIVVDGKLFLTCS